MPVLEAGVTTLEWYDPKEFDAFEELAFAAGREPEFMARSIIVRLIRECQELDQKITLWENDASLGLIDDYRFNLRFKEASMLDPLSSMAYRFMQRLIALEDAGRKRAP